jgi:hypothetical protein
LRRGDACPSSAVRSTTSTAAIGATNASPARTALLLVQQGWPPRRAHSGPQATLVTAPALLIAAPSAMGSRQDAAQVTWVVRAIASDCHNRDKSHADAHTRHRSRTNECTTSRANECTNAQSAHDHSRCHTHTPRARTRLAAPRDDVIAQGRGRRVASRHTDRRLNTASAQRLHTA